LGWGINYINIYNLTDTRDNLYTVEKTSKEERMVTHYLNRHSREKMIEIITRGALSSDITESELVDMANCLGLGEFSYSGDRPGEFLQEPDKHTETSVISGSFTPIKRGDNVITLPAYNSDFAYPFHGTVAGFKKNLIVVVDQEDNAFDLRVQEVVKDE
jgi:hypothetical protein